jgi:hypothetical protein
VHDFADKTLGKAIPYGIYDIGASLGDEALGHRAGSRRWK